MPTAGKVLILSWHSAARSASMSVDLASPDMRCYVLQQALVPGTYTTLAAIITPMAGGALEIQFNVPSAFPGGSVLLTGHYLDNR